MFLKRLRLFLPLAFFFLAQVLPADIYLTEPEVRAARLELLQMYETTMLLQGELNMQQERSKMLLEISERLRERLESALARLEASEILLEVSEAELAALLTELAVLRAEYSVLWQSLTMQKNETQKWKRRALTGWISAGLVIIGGILWGALR